MEWRSGLTYSSRPVSSGATATSAPGMSPILWSNSSKALLGVGSSEAASAVGDGCFHARRLSIAEEASFVLLVSVHG